MLSTRFIRSLAIDWNAVPSESYLRGILALTRLGTLEFTHDVTVFVGENGTGKSTLLEAIAVAAGFNREGGTYNFMHSTYDDVSELHEALTLVRGFSRPKWGQYLRAETLYNVATLVNTEYAGGYVSLPDLHAQSHGESFLSFIRYAPARSLFILDEPEAALSPRRQLDLAKLVEKGAHEGSQLSLPLIRPSSWLQKALRCSRLTKAMYTRLTGAKRTPFASCEAFWPSVCNRAGMQG